ncbi:peptide-methionine (S)-S-oxide reductase [Croceiramulus getboli]|nr:peptide-methionine (S)-S-oxide reductase [Flavobacteriaceae bacterium YJPT1-3]
MHFKEKLSVLGLGGGCHWCTEAFFQALVGIERVEQGFVASNSPHDSFSEAVLVHYNAQRIPEEVLLDIHLHTHQAEADHAFREKYRSAIYVPEGEDLAPYQRILSRLQQQFEQSLVTQVLPLVSFESSELRFQNYYRSNPERPFCQRYIEPKLQFIARSYARHFDRSKLSRLPEGRKA